MTTQQIAINVGDKIELFSGSNEWPIDVKVCHFDESFIYAQDGDNRLRISRSAIQSDDFGDLSAPAWRVNPMPSEDQIVHSARGGDTHGCRTGWTAKVCTTDSKTVLAMIIANQHCTSCWQTGCIDDGQEDNDRVGEMISFNFEDCGLDHYGQIVVNKLIS